MPTELKVVVGNGALLGLPALNAVLLEIRSEGVGAVNVRSRIMRALGTGQALSLDDAAQAIAEAVAAGDLANVATRIKAAVRSGSVPHLEDFAAGVQAVMTE